MIKSLVIGALIFIMGLGGAVIITPRYFPFGDTDFGCCPDTAIGYRWIRLAEVPFILAVALAMAGIKLWLDNRATNRGH